MPVKNFFVFLFIFLFFSAVRFADGQILITEVMYDLEEGSDSGREWIEIKNSGGETIDMTGWKLFEANVNHSIASTSGAGFSVSAGGYAVIADNHSKFLADWPDFSGVLFDSVFSLGNVGEIVAIKNPDFVETDSFSCSSGMGAAGDLNPLPTSDEE